MTLGLPCLRLTNLGYPPHSFLTLHKTSLVQEVLQDSPRLNPGPLCLLGKCSAPEMNPPTLDEAFEMMKSFFYLEESMSL